MKTRTPAHQLADLKADGQLDEIVARYIEAGVPFPAMSRLLKLDHDIDVHPESLRRWYRGDAA